MIDKSLPTTQDYSPFAKHIKKAKNKYVISFWNLSHDTLLIVPIPKRGKNFATLRDFIKNASITQQKALWKKVAQLALKSKGVWISTHGHGVPYLHIRISATPKYYGQSKLR